MDIGKLIPFEIKLINQMLHAHGIKAETHIVRTVCVPSSFIAYGLRIAQGESVKKIEAIDRELSNALTRQRVRHLPGYDGKAVVRLRDFPLALEVPHPQPTPLPWQSANLRTARYVGLVGRSYGARGPREEYIDLERHHHTLVAAMSGGGKSTLMRMALLTLAYGTAPAELRAMLVDLKNDDLTTFRRLPHCIRYAGDVDSAAQVIDYVHQVKTERIATGDKPYRLLLVIDELAELGQAKDTLRQLGSILSTGRSLGINVWAGTQYPAASAIGSVVAASFTTRLVGMVDGKNSAHVATKRAGSGAELLQTPGDFLRVDGQDLVRMKAYNIDQADTAGLVQRIAGRWKGQQAAEVIAPSHDRHTTVRQPAIPGELLPIFERCTLDDGSLKRGAMAAALRALFGNDAPASGKRYQVEAEKVNAWHIQYFTSLHKHTSLSDSHTSNEQCSGSEVKYADGKIIKLHTGSGD